MTTNKRYVALPETVSYKDTATDEILCLKVEKDYYEVLSLLNHFHDAWFDVQESLEQIRKEYDELADENEQLKQTINNFTKGENYLKRKEKVIELQKENEQLKNKIDVLEDDNETYHKSLETLNLYTKRFIPTKCTNEFKDCKTNRYYWLDHEGNFEGCLELLNLLDCENEVLKSENHQLKGRLIVYEEQMKGKY